MPPHVFGQEAASDIAATVRRLQQQVTNLENQVLRAPATGDGGTDDFVVKTGGSAISAISTDTPGTGTVTVYRVNSSGVLATTGVTETAYNIGTTSVAANTYVPAWRDTVSGKLFCSGDESSDAHQLAEFSHFGLSGSDHLRWNSSLAKVNCDIERDSGDDTKIEIPDPGWYELKTFLTWVKTSTGRISTTTATNCRLSAEYVLSSAAATLTVHTKPFATYKDPGVAGESHHNYYESRYLIGRIKKTTTTTTRVQVLMTLTTVFTGPTFTDFVPTDCSIYIRRLGDA